MTRVLSPEERKILEAAEPYVALVGTAGWDRLKWFMEEMCQRAVHDIEKNQSRDMDTVLRLRLQQRRAIREAIIEHVEGSVMERNEILDSLNEPEAEELPREW